MKHVETLESRRLFVASPAIDVGEVIHVAGTENPDQIVVREQTIDGAEELTVDVNGVEVLRTSRPSVLVVIDAGEDDDEIALQLSRTGSSRFALDGGAGTDQVSAWYGQDTIASGTGSDASSFGNVPPLTDDAAAELTEAQIAQSFDMLLPEDAEVIVTDLMMRIRSEAMEVESVYFGDTTNGHHIIPRQSFEPFGREARNILRHYTISHPLFNWHRGTTYDGITHRDYNIAAEQIVANYEVSTGKHRSNFDRNDAFALMQIFESLPKDHVIRRYNDAILADILLKIKHPNGVPPGAQLGDEIRSTREMNILRKRIRLMQSFAMLGGIVISFAGTANAAIEDPVVRDYMVRLHKAMIDEINGRPVDLNALDELKDKVMAAIPAVVGDASNNAQIVLNCLNFVDFLHNFVKDAIIRSRTPYIR